MTRYYGIMTTLAMVALASASLAQTPEPAKADNVRPASVRLAPVKVVDQTPAPGLADTTQQVERYFNNLSSMQAKFKQTVTGDAGSVKGTFSWLKPGRFLWQYESPVKQQLISTGSAVYFIDDRKQVTQLPMDAGVARLFNAKTLNFSKQGLRPTRVQSNSKLLVAEYAVDKKIATGDNTGLTELRLVFDRLPGERLQLRQIDAIDTTNAITKVEFSDVRENVGLNAKMFAYTPDIYEQRN